SACTCGSPSDLGSFEDLDRLALGMELDDRLLPARAHALVDAAPLRLRLHRNDVDLENADVEELLDGLPDLRLVRVRMDLERVLALVDHRVALLAHDGCEQDLAGVHQAALPWTSGSADSLTSSARAQTTAATSSSAGVVTTTRSTFRKLLTIASCSCCAT